VVGEVSRDKDVAVEGIGRAPTVQVGEPDHVRVAVQIAQKVRVACREPAQEEVGG